MTGYVRVDTGNNIADGNVISAADLDNEFDGVQAAFNLSTGHTHGGAVGEGAPITKIGPTQDVTASAVLLAPKTTNFVDIGSSLLKFKDLYLAGNASIGGTLAVTGVATFTAQPVLSSLTASKAVFSDGSKGLVSNDITGTGNVVMSNSPTLVTPALGTPSSVTLTNATGLPVASGISGLAAGVATFLATPSSSNLASAVTDETGTGALVFANSPTLVTPALGTPSSATLTNATGLPVATGISGLGTGVATFLATPSSANLASAVSDETGTGALVFANSPTLVTPALGTPASATLTNATGLPIATGVSGLGTGVATALAVNIGSAGAAVVNGGALGTPSSGTLTNATGLPIASGVSGLGTGVATALAVNVGSAGAAVVNGGALGTPSSGTLTNATGLPVATGISGLGTGVATFLATPSSANLASAVSDETGSGALVFANSPTLVTPALGTPSSATLTNATGLPIATGVSGLGTGIATALAVNAGSAGAPVLFNGALGTPSSGTVTNLTGTASININGTVGATTPATGAFTTLEASSTATLNTLSSSGATLTGGTINNMAIGGTTAAAGAFTSVTASADSSFNSTGAVKLSTGTTAERPTGAAGKLRFNTSTSEFEGHNGTTWSSVGGSSISNDTSTSTNLYPLFAAATTGTATSVYTSNDNYLFKPSTGELSVKAPRASNGIIVNSATISEDYTIASGDNGGSFGPVAVASGITVTVSSGSVWTVV